MFTLTDKQPDLNVQESEYQRLLGFPIDFQMEGRSRELADWARGWYAQHGRPSIYARQIDGVRLGSDRLHIGDTEFSSRLIHDQFAAAKSDAAVLVAVSAGRECEEKARELWNEGKPDEYFFMEMYGSAVVEHLVTIANGRICGWADNNRMVALPHYSPGYSGWDVADQIKLWNLIQQSKTAELPDKLEVLETGMLRPKKSLLAVVGVTRHLETIRHSRQLIPCESCALSRCQYRRSPYKHSLPQIEDVRRLGSKCDDLTLAEEMTSRLQHNAKYSVNQRALQNWSRDRLQLNTLPDGSTEALFRYEGTTCSSLGAPLEFLYRIKLSPAGNGYLILDESCAPAPGDIGHTRQCEYLTNAESLMRHITTEKPLLGKPLDDALMWERAYSPSGCYCDADRRAHKWGLVFEVLHYALVQREKAQTNGQKISDPI